MVSGGEYQLLDFGDGRKLERFGPYLLDRPAPAASDAQRAHAALWTDAAARYERGGGGQGQWTPADALPDHWIVRFEGLTLELRPTPFGHVGLFPEQGPNCRWLAEQVRAAGQPLAVLNLFAYTGAATLALAAAGAQVTHVDAAENVVAWARRNAAHSKLVDKPVRWIAEDALTFARRELKRGRSYQGVVLDPPSYGHGPTGQTWQIERDLPELLAVCAELTAADRRFILLSCHSQGHGPAELGRLLAQAMRVGPTHCRAEELAIATAEGRRLPSGATARWSA